MVTADSSSDVDFNTVEWCLARVLSSVFIGFNSETVASVLLSLQENGSAFEEARKATAADELRLELGQLQLPALQSRAKAALKHAPDASILKLNGEALIQLLVGAGVRVRMISHVVMEKLVQCAIPEAVVKYAWLTGRGLNGERTPVATGNTYTNMARLYFEQQTHSSLWDYISVSASSSSHVQATVITFQIQQST